MRDSHLAWFCQMYEELSKADGIYGKKGPFKEGLPWSAIVNRNAEIQPLNELLRYRGEVDPKWVIYPFNDDRTYEKGVAEDTWTKFDVMYAIKLQQGNYGPFCRYSPECADSKDSHSGNVTGGYFTTLKEDCLECVKRKLFLYDRSGKFIYSDCSPAIYRYDYVFEVNEHSWAWLYIGNVAHGKAVQIRPTNWILGYDNQTRIENRNKVYRFAKYGPLNCMAHEHYPGIYGACKHRRGGRPKRYLRAP